MKIFLLNGPEGKSYYTSSLRLIEECYVLIHFFDLCNLHPITLSEEKLDVHIDHTVYMYNSCASTGDAPQLNFDEAVYDILCYGPTRQPLSAGYNIYL